jgi:hypothetical protein
MYPGNPLDFDALHMKFFVRFLQCGILHCDAGPGNEKGARLGAFALSY